MIRTAIVGLGKMGISHCAIVNANPKVDLVAVCDTSSLVLQTFKKYTTIKCYTDYEQLLTNEKLDALVVATPTKFHYKIVKDALEKNINVFCEKPFSLFTSEGKELVDLATSSGLVNQVGYHNRFLGTFKELHRLTNENLIGEVYHFLGEAYGPVVVKDKGSSWRGKKEEGGGCLLDYASHVINLIQYIVGLPVKAEGSLLKSIYSKQVEDTVYSTLTLDNGISGNLSVNWSDETYRKMSTSITLFGKKGKIVCDATELKIYLKEENKKERLDKGWNIRYITDLTEEVPFYLRGEEYSSQMDTFFDCVLEKRPSGINSFHSALQTDEVIELIRNNNKD